MALRLPRPAGAIARDRCPRRLDVEQEQPLVVYELLDDGMPADDVVDLLSRRLDEYREPQGRVHELLAIVARGEKKDPPSEPLPLQPKTGDLFNAF